MLDILLKYAQEPAVITAVVYLLTTLLPKSRLDSLQNALLAYIQRWPIVGFLVKLITLYFQSIEANAMANKVSKASIAAGVLVRGAEQLKSERAGAKIDSATAATQITNTLVKRFKLDPDTARKVTEEAVYTMNKALW